MKLDTDLVLATLYPLHPFCSHVIPTSSQLLILVDVQNDQSDQNIIHNAEAFTIGGWRL